MFHSPYVHFFLLGFTLLWLQVALDPAADSKPSIVIDEKRLEALRASWVLNRGALPTLEQQRYLLALEVEDQVLLAEARDRGYEQLPVVQRRLQQLGGFLSDSTQADGEQARQQGQALGLEYTDPLIRTYLINAMRERLAAEVDIALPTESDVQTYYDNHPGNFQRPRRVSISHVYTGGLADESKQNSLALSKALDGQEPSHETIALGSPFYGGHDFNYLNQVQLAKQFGGNFAKHAIALPVGEWSEPIASSYGYHRVFVREEQAASLQPLAVVAASVRQQLERERREAAVKESIQALMASYTIETPALN